ncbi:hypothetical protein NA56DRAFT_336571 [Hyaloscypha hepaticicola]|uniref:Uncharacterized protein n=1 Tax=Hyaloscypha hepaticicola TaxID=2082293 RepID=A0A2J6QIN2_9HELO|nr:hypothetical protein NA56DRAFT_336571 [Hyaloscypha hepaticicola]
MFNCHEKGEMKIEHITYDNAHAPRSKMRRASDTTVRIKSYISKRLSRHADMETPIQNSAERPTTIWPRFETVPDTSEMAAYLTQQHRGEKAVRKEGIITFSAKRTSNYLPLKDEGAAADDASYSSFRRKEKFVKEKKSIKLKSSRPQTVDGNPNMEKLYKLRQAITDGRMEQIVPPRHTSEGRRAPPRNPFAGPAPRFLDETSRDCSSSRHSSPHSSQSGKTRSSRVRDYIRTGAATLDEKRKEVQSKFRASSEHIKYPSFSKARHGSAASEESFFCAGENGQQQISNKNSKARRHDSTEDKRYSGIGTNPWSSHVPDTCKICRKFAMAGIQGICERCESDFWPRKDQNQNSDSEYEDDLRPTPPLQDKDEDDIKPTPPLKDAKTLSMRKKQEPQHYFQVEKDSLENVRSTIVLKDMGSRPLFNPVLVRQFSQRAQVEGDEDGLTHSQKMVERWSTNIEDNGHAYAYAEEGDTAILLRRKSNALEKAGSRDTNFYCFYDDVFDD